MTPVTARAGRREALLVVCVLATMLGVGLTAAGRGGAERLQQVGAEASSVSARMALPGTTASPIPVGDYISSAPACPQAHFRLSRPTPPGLGVIDEDPREYLSAMAVWRTRRQGDAVTTSDPYQAALNPAVYLIGLEVPRHGAARRSIRER